MKSCVEHSESKLAIDMENLSKEWKKSLAKMRVLKCQRNLLPLSLIAVEKKSTIDVAVRGILDETEIEKEAEIVATETTAAGVVIIEKGADAMTVATETKFRTDGVDDVAIVTMREDRGDEIETDVTETAIVTAVVIAVAVAVGGVVTVPETAMIAIVAGQMIAKGERTGARSPRKKGREEMTIAMIAMIQARALTVEARVHLHQEAIDTVSKMCQP
mmetsp:Transcript_26345/g.36768  ORF Transcript_26345/g.36768 Transcript_26345/m.36768 type:complete len:217 (-) Transcript_26345:94-744(-)